eukprot:8233046-Karenia_brevis.AAC.1
MDGACADTENEQDKPVADMAESGEDLILPTLVENVQNEDDPNAVSEDCNVAHLDGEDRVGPAWSHPTTSSGVAAL